MFKTKTKAKLPLVGADSPDKAFWAVDGHIFHNLVEMRDALGAMSDLTVSYHVNRDKNDFVGWVREVAKDEKLAHILESKKTRLAMLHAVIERLRDYQL